MFGMTAVSSSTLFGDCKAGLVVFFVALPLCLGIALASGAPLMSGLLAGIVGGSVVGLLSGSHTSVSGPAAGLSAVVAAQILSLGSFSTFLMALMLAGVIQIGLGVAKGGFISEFFPSSVIKGLLAAIGVIITFKQIPHLVGHDSDPEGDMSFSQPDLETTFSELFRMFGDYQLGAAVVGLLSVALLILWDNWKPLKMSLFPAPVAVVLFGIGGGLWFEHLGDPWVIKPSHLVQVPVAGDLAEWFELLPRPDFSQWMNPAVYTAGITLALVASLETLLNLNATDRLDPQQRTSPPSQELLAQGIGNVACGLVGGLPVTSVIIRSSVNVTAGGRTMLATIIHGTLLLVTVPLIPTWLNAIPLSCLAAILLMTGIKLASPALMKQMWREGRYQFIPFVATVAAIVLTDLLIGIVIGLAVSIGFILNSNMRRPVRRFVSKHLGGEVVHIELANQESFLNRAALTAALNEVPRNGRVLLDARNTDYIDPDVLGLIRDFKETAGPVRGIDVSLIGFLNEHKFKDQIQNVDYSTRELQASLTPQRVLQILRDGHERMRTGRRLPTNSNRQGRVSEEKRHPLALVVSCSDAVQSPEQVFDMGMGDILSVRIAGHVMSPEVIASVEYGCVRSGAKLILIMGHTRCGAIAAAMECIASARTDGMAKMGEPFDPIVREIQQSVKKIMCSEVGELLLPVEVWSSDFVARHHVVWVGQELRARSQMLDSLVQERRIAIVGSMYDGVTGGIEFLVAEGVEEMGERHRA